jgi:uncharacterized caspase-like protein
MCRFVHHGSTLSRVGASGKPGPVQPDVALLFYAGHGQQRDDKNYLIPIDAQISRHAHLQTRAVTLDLYLRTMTRRAPTSLVFLDACRNNTISRSLGMASRSGEPEIGLASPHLEIDDHDDAAAFIAFATAPGKTADDGHDSANSPFTSALLQHIQTPGLALEDIMYEVINTVLATTNKKQRPWFTSSFGNKFYLIPALKTHPRVGELSQFQSDKMEGEQSINRPSSTQ